MKTRTYIFPVILAMMATAILLQSCVYDVNSIKGNKNIVTAEKDLTSFESLQIGGIFKVTLSEGSAPHIRIETDENIHEFITAEVRNNTLFLSMERGSYDPSRLEVYITTDRPLQKIDISGAASISTQNPLSADNLTISTSGASNLEIEVQSEKLTTSVSGAGKVDIRGEARQHEVRISGVATVNCRDLTTEKTRVSISGAGKARVHATESIDATVSGVGSIRYSGDPSHVRTASSGAGSIRPV